MKLPENLLWAALACAAAAGAPSPARVAIISFATAANSSAGGQPVSAKATFHTAANPITIQLENLQAIPPSLAYSLSRTTPGATIAAGIALALLSNEESFKWKA